MGDQTIVSERIDELPMLIYSLKQMQVAEVIDQKLPTPHGNWEGLSYGELAEVFVAYTVMNCTHFLSPMEEWAAEHLVSLSQALGKTMRVADFTDDRLAILLSALGNEETHPGEKIEIELGQRMIRAYQLPTDTARIDMTGVSVYHQPKAEKAGLMRRNGYSKDHRTDLHQFKVVLGTLDPAGMPLATGVLSGEQADDPHYIPTWERLTKTIGHTTFLAVGDSKMGSLGIRAHIQDKQGYYLMPLPMTGKTPEQLQAWVLEPPCPPQAIWLPEQTADEPAVGQGFEVTVDCSWQDPDTEETINWNERRLVVQSEAHAAKRRNCLEERLAKAEESLLALNSRPAAEKADLERRAQAIMKRYRVTEYLSLHFIEQVTCETRYVGPGRPGPKRATQTIAIHTWALEVTRQTDAVDLSNQLAGWRIYATNTAAGQLDLPGAVNCYRQEWQPEYGFHRLKGGLLAIMPLYIRDDERITGLLLLLSIALRLLTLTEFAVRRDLAETNESLKGLYAGNPNRSTNRPSAERLLKTFDNITLYRLETDAGTQFEVTPLSPLQRRILQALQIPDTIYDPPPVSIIAQSPMLTQDDLVSRDVEPAHPIRFNTRALSPPDPAFSTARPGAHLSPPQPVPIIDTS